jgi:hypothetical protein
MWHWNVAKAENVDPSNNNGSSFVDFDVPNLPDENTAKMILNSQSICFYIYILLVT